MNRKEKSRDVDNGVSRKKVGGHHLCACSPCPFLFPYLGVTLVSSAGPEKIRFEKSHEKRMWTRCSAKIRLFSITKWSNVTLGIENFNTVMDGRVDWYLSLPTWALRTFGV